MSGARTGVAVRLDGVVVEAGGRRLLQVPELEIRHGERVALVGPNGAGKSTLLRVVGGFAPAARGRLTVLGRSFGPGVRPPPDRRAWRRLRADIGQLFQGLHLVPRLTARENAILGALGRPGAVPRWRSWARLYPASLRAEADAALAALGLAQRADTRADRLSGGERQKVGIARLQLQRPRLLLADEPTSALDPAATGSVCAALLAAADDATLVTVVHHASLLPLLADRVIGLAAGRVVFDLPRAQLDDARLGRLYASPPHAGVGAAATAATPPAHDRPSPLARPAPEPAGSAS